MIDRPVKFKNQQASRMGFPDYFSIMGGILMAVNKTPVSEQTQGMAYDQTNRFCKTQFMGPLKTPAMELERLPMRLFALICGLGLFTWFIL